MGGLLHLIQRGEAWAGAGWGPAQSPPRCTKCNSPPINNGQCTNHYIPLLCRFNVAIKGLNRDVAGSNRSRSASGVWSAANSSALSCGITSTQWPWMAQTHAYVVFFPAGISTVRVRVRSRCDPRYESWLPWLSGNALASINVVALRQTRLVTVCGRVNHLGM